MSALQLHRGAPPRRRTLVVRRGKPKHRLPSPPRPALMATASIAGLVALALAVVAGSATLFL